jgi:Fur family transcriptional regulator, ferric uptake regulator
MSLDRRPVTADRVDELLSVVRANGGRATSARRAILQTLLEHQDVHPTAEHITAAVRQSQPEVAESTVYRFLDELERLGIIDHVRLGHGPEVYHFAEHTQHHHLVCRNRGRVIEVPQQVFDSLRRQLLDTFSFQIQPHHFTLSGHCVQCQPHAVEAHGDHSHGHHSHT